MSDTKSLTKLGSNKTKYNYNKPEPNLLETFENLHPKWLYVIPFECFEFSSLCPKTGQPDFAKIYINYIPKEKCVESKSLKLYLFSFRNSGEFMEDVTNRIADDLNNLLNPLYLEVYCDFNSRGGIYLRPFVTRFNAFASQEQKALIMGVIENYRDFKKL